MKIIQVFKLESLLDPILISAEIDTNQQSGSVADTDLDSDT